MDVTIALTRLAEADSGLIHIKALDLPQQPKKLVIDTSGVGRRHTALPSACLLPTVHYNQTASRKIRGRIRAW